MIHKSDPTGGFNSIGEFAVTVRKEVDRVRHDSRLEPLLGKTMSGGTDSAGGFTIPEQWAGEIRHAALEGSIVRSRAMTLPMVSDTANLPVLLDSDRSSNIFGGVTLTWLEEAEEKATSATDPVLANLKLVAHDGVAITFVSNALMSDYEKAPRKFSDFIKLAFGKAVRFYEDDYFIWGDGVGKPLGIMSSSGRIDVNRQNITQVSAVDIGNMAESLLPASWATAVWLISPEVLANWSSQTTRIHPVVNLSNMRCLGRPIIVTEKCQALGTTGDIILADFENGYVIGDREMEIAGSRETNYNDTSGYLQNQTCWKIVLRVDGQPLLTSAITPKRGTSGKTKAHFVALTFTS